MSYIAEQILAAISIDETRTALLFKDETHTWGDVKRLVTEFNHTLDSLNVGEAAPIGCLLRTRPAHFETILGVVAGERCIVTLNPLMPDDKLAEDIVAMAPPVVVGDADDWARPAVVEAVRQIGAAGILLTGDRQAPVALVKGLEKVGPGPFAEPKPGVAVLMLTSGTTGKPKRAPLGYRQLELNIKRAARAEPGWTETSLPTLKDEIGLMFSPFVHISGLYFVISTTIGGRATRLIEKFSVEAWRQAVKEVKPKMAGGPPTVLKMILDANLPKEDLGDIVAFTCGTAPLHPDVIDEFVRRYDTPVLPTYGATEFAGAVCGWSIASFRKYWTAKRGAAGRMHPGVEARTVNPETGEALPPGEAGVLELRSEALGGKGGWVRTSDLARVDADHFLFILGRNDNAIIRGGFKVMPDSVVSVMEQHPAIKEASVVGIADDRLGAVPVAAYILKAGATAPSDEELTAFLRAQLTPYQVPVAFRRLDEMPRTPSLKVSMPAVRALFEDSGAKAK